MIGKALLPRVGGALGVVVVIGSCKTNNPPAVPIDAAIDAPPPIDGPPPIAYEGLVPTEWSLANANNRWQIAISDVAGNAACALSADQHNGLGVAGGEIIIQLPDASTG